MGALIRTVIGDKIKHVSGILQENELPEKMLVVEYNSRDDCLLVVTNVRFMFITDKLFSLNKFNTRDYLCEAITDVEWAPGRLRHRITIRIGRKKEVCYGMSLLWQDGQFPSRKMAEHLQSKIPGGQVSVASDDRTAKLHAIEDFVRNLGEGARAGIRGADIKQLQDILKTDEMPERLISAQYDGRHGLNVSSLDNPHGILVSTAWSLIFVSKTLGSRACVEIFPYNKIEQVEFSKGWLSNKVTITVSGLQEIFVTSRGKAFAKYLEGKARVAMVQRICRSLSRRLYASSKVGYTRQQSQQLRRSESQGNVTNQGGGQP